MTSLALDLRAPPGRDEIGRWSLGFAAVVAAHVLFAFIALYRSEPPETAAEPPAAILIDLAPSAPSMAAPSELPPAPDQVAAPDAPTVPDVTETDIAPTLTMDDLEAEAEADATPEPVREAEAEVETRMTFENFETSSEAVEEPAAPMSETTVSERVALDDIAPAAEAAKTPLHQAEAALTETLDPGELDGATEAAAEPVLQVEAGIMPEISSMQELKPEAAPQGTAPSPAAEANPEAMAAFEATRAPLPRPRPDVVPELRPAPPPPARTAATERRREPARPRATAARPPAPQTTSPALAPSQSQASAAPRAGAAAAAPSVSPDRWRSAVYRHLERNKRYPSAAERRRIGGTARVRFTIDRNGNILRHRIVTGTGNADLDQAVNQMIARASPVPAPPPELYRAGMSIEVPIRFAPR